MSWDSGEDSELLERLGDNISSCLVYVGNQLKRIADVLENTPSDAEKRDLSMVPEPKKEKE